MMHGSDDIAALYDRWSRTYDTDPNRTRDLASEVLRAELSDLVGGAVVELGCGTGRNTGWLAERAASVTALDFSSRMLERARASVEGERVRFVEHDIREGLPLDDGAFDLAAIVLVLEHVESLGPVFRECRRVIRPGGHLFVCELHPYRQWAGAQAQFTDVSSGRRTRVPAYAHEVSAFVNEGQAAGLRLVRMGEWRHERDRIEQGPPRLLSVLYRRNVA